MPIINLTGVTVRIADENDEVYKTIEPDERNVRVRSTGKETEVDGVPIETTHVTEVEGLPDPEEDTYYIVPQPVAKVVADRPDLVTPDTGPSAIRDENQNVYAVRRLFSVSRSTD